jgi:hypothetical protein
VIKFEKIKAGDELWDYHSERAGNTTMRRWSNWRVEVRSVDAVARTAVVSWNGNPDQTWTCYRLERLRRKPGKERGLW